ncbi:hypothetical protein Tco_1210910 [Tanacetum coccineum]
MISVEYLACSESLKEEMLHILPFKCGKLPMKYLGVPLLVKRLGVKDCQSLIDNVRNRINCWRNKFLSYAGRIQLIASVLSVMHQYWASVYMHPIVVTNEIEKLFKSFLWNPDGSARVKLKGKSIWEADIESNDSHEWKELMRIRDKINLMDIYDVRMSNETCLANAIKDGRWKWADEWSIKFPELC